MRGAATLFFSFIGFDSVTTDAGRGGEEAPERDLPIGIIGTLGVTTLMYVSVSLVITGMVRFDALSTESPLSSAFVSVGVRWAGIVISIGTVTTLTLCVLCTLLVQPRINSSSLSFFLSLMEYRVYYSSSCRTKINKRKVPVASTILTGTGSAIIACLFSLKELANMISIGTLMAFTVVITYSFTLVIILRYKSPEHPHLILVWLALYFLACVGFSEYAAPLMPLWGTLLCGIPLVAIVLYMWIRFQLRPQNPTAAAAAAALVVKCPLVPFRCHCTLLFCNSCD
eukprot:GEZU01027066.1.p1 GENE.GEZU01027066.1~~GEZU01027066.1.p1  ORF type:complete len:284 (+),score=42.98 GEZU01027066.1:265-1116(+)